MYIKYLLLITCLQTTFEVLCGDGGYHVGQRIDHASREEKMQRDQHHRELIQELRALRGDMHALQQTQLQMVAALEAQTKCMQHGFYHMFEQMRQPKP